MGGAPVPLPNHVAVRVHARLGLRSKDALACTQAEEEIFYLDKLQWTYQHHHLSQISSFFFGVLHSQRPIFEEVRPKTKNFKQNRKV